MIVELGVAALLLSMFGKKTTPKDTVVVVETAQEKLDREAKEREAARIAAETSYRITTENAKTEADKKELDRINKEIQDAADAKAIEDAKYFNLLSFGRDTKDPIVYKAMQLAYQNKSISEGKLFRVITNIVDPMTGTVIPAGKEFKLALGKYKSQQFAEPMVVFWGGKDNAVWYPYFVKNLYEITYPTSPVYTTVDSFIPAGGPGASGKVTPGGSGTTSGGTTTSSSTGGVITSGPGMTVSGIKRSPSLGGYYYGK